MPHFHARLRISTIMPFIPLIILSGNINLWLGSTGPLIYSFVYPILSQLKWAFWDFDSSLYLACLKRKIESLLDYTCCLNNNFLFVYAAYLMPDHHNCGIDAVDLLN